MDEEIPNLSRLLVGLPNWSRGTIRFEALQGGLLNRVYRIRCGSQRAILKYSPPHVASQPAIALSPGRNAQEARLLRALAPGGELNPLRRDEIFTPRILAHRPEHSLLLIEDLGDRLNAAQALASGQDIGPAMRALGSFLARLHERRLDPFSKRLRYPEMSAARRNLGYGRVARLLLELEPKLCRVLEQWGQRATETQLCLTMGDLWPPSVRPVATGVELLDWELANLAHPALDLGHWLAHLWMLNQRLHADLVASAAAAFLHGYGPIREDISSEISMQAGYEILMRNLGPFAQQPCQRPMIEMGMALLAGKACILYEFRDRSLVDAG